VHIAALVISLICAIFSLFQGGIAMIFGGAGAGLAEFVGEESTEMSLVAGFGAFIFIAAFLGIIGGIFASLRKKAGWILLAIATAITLLAGIGMYGGMGSGMNDGFLYAVGYGLASFLAFRSCKATVSAETQPVPSPTIPLVGETGQPKIWTCNSCMTENAPENRFCFSCGREREKPKPVCPQCGKENQLGMKFCPSCGTALPSQVDTQRFEIEPARKQECFESRDDKPTGAVLSFPAKAKGFLFLALGVLVIMSPVFYVYVRLGLKSDVPTLANSVSNEGDVLVGKATSPVSDAQFLLLCQKGTPAEIQAAIKAGANVNAYSEDEELNALMYAAIGNPHPETIRMLVNAGADVNETFGSRSNSGMTALMYAAEKNPNPEILIELVKAGADVDEKDLDGGTPLKYATVNRNEEVLKVLLKSGAHVNDKDHYGETVLHFASSNSSGWMKVNPNSVRILLENGADVHIRDEFGRTPLFCVAGSYKPNPKVVAMLLKAGADVNAIRDNGWTPLIAAVFECNDNTNLEVISLLLKAGADVNAIDNDGKRAIDFAREKKNLKGTEVYRRLEAATAKE
jgi:ankyrin repeat protein